ncbi:MAG: Rrf2 family transcriptional regulator [Verrucomicrobia bacterium]|nr:Rrf2 family transcriptional regulator [Verrucomicrobiota bacterium]
MFGLSQSVGYAIQALTFLGDRHGGEAGLVRSVAAESGAPAPYLAKLFKKLVDAGIVESKRGFRGGSRLARPAEEISLFDISAAIDGSEWLGACMLGQAECSDARSCPAHGFWKDARRRIEDRLRRTTLADVIAFERHRRAQSTPSAEPVRRRSRRLATP